MSETRLACDIDGSGSVLARHTGCRGIDFFQTVIVQFFGHLHTLNLSVNFTGNHKEINHEPHR